MAPRAYSEERVARSAALSKRSIMRGSILRSIFGWRVSSTQIDSGNATSLTKKWQSKFPGSGVYRNYATAPVVLNGVFYFQDLNSP